MIIIKKMKECIVKSNFCVKNRFCDAHHNNRTGVAVNKAPLLQNKALIRFVEDW
jgi:hypothetical protein